MALENVHQILCNIRPSGMHFGRIRYLYIFSVLKRNILAVDKSSMNIFINKPCPFVFYDPSHKFPCSGLNFAYLVLTQIGKKNLRVGTTLERILDPTIWSVACHLLRMGLCTHPFERR